MTSRSFNLLAASALGATLACAGGGAGGADAQVNDVNVVLDTVAPFSKAGDFPDRLQTTIAAALEYWGGDWSDVQGRTLTLVDDDYVPCRGQQALGCYDGAIRLTTRDPGVGTVACIEQTVLVHEIGHAVIGDANHTDPRWMEMDSVAQALAGRVGYAADGSTLPCTTYASVWRHPTDVP